MENYLKRLIIITVIALLLTSCSDDGPSTPFSYDCSVFPDQATSEYILPYEVGSSFTAFPHAAQISLPESDPAVRAIYYGIDIKMPIGTPIVAIRSGTVVHIEEMYDDFDNTVGHENFVIVEHEDGTFSRYFHLTNQGALVNVGDPVLQLKTIASSGHTGNSTEPHLHFDVVDESCDPFVSVHDRTDPCQTLPVTFHNTRALDCGLEWKETYMALSF